MDLYQVSMHPAEEIRGMSSSYLENKTIILGITGSIAAVECIKLARELIRHGAQVIPVMTSAATRIVHPDAIWFATGIKPILELTGETEHVSFCGNVNHPADLLLISPATANTISKIANGIDDTPVTTFATTALGSKIPIIIVPAMHESMYHHSILQTNIKRLREIGITFIDPCLDGVQAKIPSTEIITTRIIRQMGSKKLDKKNILVIGGGTAEPIDDVRMLCNKSSGKTALTLSRIGWYQGANVSLWIGKTNQSIPSYIPINYFSTLSDIKKLIEKTDLSYYDFIILCAALSDFIPQRKKGKIQSSTLKLDITCTRAQKILPLLRKHAPQATIVGFKLQTTKDQSIKEAQTLLKKTNCNFVVANTIDSIDNTTHELWLIESDKQPVHLKGLKEEVIHSLYDHII